MIWASFFMGLVLFFACVIFVLVRSRRTGSLVLLDWGILGVGLVYGLGWVLVLSFTLAGFNGYWQSRLDPYKGYYLIHNFLGFSIAFFIALGWYLSARVSGMSRRVAARALTLDQGRAHLYAWALLILAVLTRWLYVRDFGGFVAYLDHAAAVRSGMASIQNRFSFLQPFSGIAIFASFLFFGLLSERRSAARFVGLLLSMAFSVYVLTSLMGRVGFLIYVATFVLAWVQMKRVRPFVAVFGGLFGACIVVVAAYLLSEWLNVKGADNLPSYVARELSFPFASFFAQLDSGEHLFRWYRDFLVAPLYLAPSSWWSAWFEDVSSINTYVVMGARSGDSGQVGGIPVDLITLGLMQSSAIGVAVVGVLFGMLLRLLQGFSDGINLEAFKITLWAYFSIRVGVVAVAYAHPLHLINGTFGIIFSVVVLAAMSFMSRVRVGK